MVVMAEFDRLAANPRLDAARRRVTALQHDLRLTVDIDQTQGVARIDQMWVMDLGIDLPDLRPVPRIAQEDLGDAPEGIAALHHVAVGGIVGERDASARHFRRFRRRGRAGLDRGFHRRLFVAHHRAFHGGLIGRHRGCRRGASGFGAAEWHPGEQRNR